MSIFAFKNKRSLAIALMTLGSIIISFNGLVLRNIDHADQWTIIFYRAVAFSSAVYLFLLFQYKKKVLVQITKIGSRGLTAGLFLGSANMFFILSMTTTTVANTVFTISLIPFITAIFAMFFLREKLAKITIYTMISALVGVIIMFYGALDSGKILGNIFALCTAISFSIFAIILRSNKHLDMLPCLLISGLIAMTVSCALKMGSLQISLNDMLLSFLLGGFMSALVNCCFVFATRYMVAAEATLFFFLEISLSPIWVWLFANESTARSTLIGGTFVLLSLLIRGLYIKFAASRNSITALPK